MFVIKVSRKAQWNNILFSLVIFLARNILYLETQETGKDGDGEERRERHFLEGFQEISLFAARITFQLRKLDSNKSRFWIRSKSSKRRSRGNWTNGAREEE